MGFVAYNEPDSLHHHDLFAELFEPARNVFKNTIQKVSWPISNNQKHIIGFTTLEALV